jgi:hypothetical protein
VVADYIAQHAEEWVDAWLESIRRDPTTPHYHDYPDPQELTRDAAASYHYLGLWLRTGDWDSRIDPYFERIGRVRREEGFRLSEVISAILLAKRHLWDGMVAGEQLSVALEIEIANAFRLFYDQAIYHTVLGYESAP